MDDQEGSVIYSWEASEFLESRALGTRTDWVLGIVWLGLLGWAIWARQWIGLAVVMMAGVAVLLLRIARPRVFTHALTDKGVLIGKKFYPYSHLKSFWILLVGSNRVVNFLTDKKWGLALTLQLGDADVDKVREALIGKLTEDASRGEDMVDRFGKLL